MVSKTSIFQPGEFAHGNQEFFTVYTVVDITDTGVKRGNSKESFQAQNLSNVLQAIGLRCQPIISSVLKLTGQAMADYSFGSNFIGSHTVWALKFATEHSDQTSASALENDLNGIPMYFTGLDHTVADQTALDTTSATDKNIYFIVNTNL
jgi:hypothetical protein